MLSLPKLQVQSLVREISCVAQSKKKEKRKKCFKISEEISETNIFCLQEIHLRLKDIEDKKKLDSMEIVAIRKLERLNYYQTKFPLRQKENITRTKRDHLILIGRLIHQEDIAGLTKKIKGTNCQNQNCRNLKNYKENDEKFHAKKIRQLT